MSAKAMSVALDAVYAALEKPQETKPVEGTPVLSFSPEWVEENYVRNIDGHRMEVRSWLLRGPAYRGRYGRETGRVFATLIWRQHENGWEGYTYDGATAIGYRGVFKDLARAKAALEKAQ